MLQGKFFTILKTQMLKSMVNVDTLKTKESMKQEKRYPLPPSWRNKNAVLSPRERGNSRTKMNMTENY